MSNDITHTEYPHSFDLAETALRQVDLNLLLVFAMIFRHGSVRAAAERLYLGPSGVSMALNRLRAHVSDPLFIRGKQGLEPTAFARVLYERIGPALAMIGSAMSPRTFLPEKALGTVRLALSEDLEVVLAPRLNEALARLAPGLKLVIRHGDYRRAAELLDEDVADFVVTARPATVDARHRCQDLMNETFVVLSAADRFDSGRSITLKEYLSCPHALVSASGAISGKIDEALADRALTRTVRVTTESFAALPFLLQRGTLIANVPRTVGVALARVFGLALHDLPFDSPSFAIAMTWRARDDQDAALKWMRELVCEQMTTDLNVEGHPG